MTSYFRSGCSALDKTKFGRTMQNDMQITGKWSRSKPEVEFQWRTFVFQTGSSNISAVNGDMSTKFCLAIDFDLLKALTSTNTKAEVVLSGGGRHVVKSMTSYYRRGWSDLDEIHQPGGE